MSEPIAGIHHVTAMATDPQKNLDFYEGSLGLRLVKKTVNFDDPGTYHLYYGDELGQPGTILTFFPSPRAPHGRRGCGQATVTSFSIPEGSLGFWQERVGEHGIVAEAPTSRFEEDVLTLYDPDGLKLELIARPGDDIRQPWGDGTVAPEYAIRGFHSVTLAVRELDATAKLLTETMGLRSAISSDNRFRFEAGQGVIGRRVDVLHAPDKGVGTSGAGTVHHVAWRVPDDPAQEAWRDKLAGVGFRPTQVLDRHYFKSIYFREPGGTLFEFATDPPGFTRDEEPAELGADLKLPPWLEPERERIEQALPEIARSG